MLKVLWNRYSVEIALGIYFGVIYMIGYLAGGMQWA